MVQQSIGFSYSVSLTQLSSPLSNLWNPSHLWPKFKIFFSLPLNAGHLITLSPGPRNAGPCQFPLPQAWCLRAFCLAPHGFHAIGISHSGWELEWWSRGRRRKESRVKEKRWHRAIVPFLRPREGSPGQDPSTGRYFTKGGECHPLPNPMIWKSKLLWSPHQWHPLMCHYVLYWKIFVGKEGSSKMPPGVCTLMCSLPRNG